VAGYEVRATDRHLAEEFKARPIGHHSTELQRVMNVFRGQPMAGKYVLLCTKPHEEWVLAQLPDRRGQPLRIHHNRVFTSIDEAEWEVFRMRWEHFTGETLPD